MRVARGAVASIVMMLVLGTPAAAAFEGVEFTELLDDGGDHPLGYHDFGTLSVGEPGDGTVVFRGTVGDIGQLPRDDATIMYFGFTTDAFILGGAFYDLQLVTRNVGDAILPDECQKDAAQDAIYCAWSYDRIRAAPGMTLTNIWGFIDGCASRTGCLPMDTGPGSIANQGWNPASTPIEYLLTGCTVLAGCATGPSAATIFDDLAAPSFTHAFSNATYDTYVLNFTTDLVNSTANFSWEATNGTVSATLADANGTVVFEGGFEGNGTLAQDLVAVPGQWNLTLVYDGFVGDLSFDLAPMEVLVEEVPVETEPEGNETLELDDADKDTPLPLLVPLVGVLAALGMRRRR